MASGTDEDPILLARINDGRTVPCKPCRCCRCDGEWFVPGYSDEWMPSYCPYCGLKFIGRVEGEYLPRPSN